MTEVAPKRAYHRRSDEELMQNLQDQMDLVKKRMASKVRPDALCVEKFPRVKAAIKVFCQAAVDCGREDLSNMALAFLSGLERAIDQVPEPNETFGE